MTTPATWAFWGALRSLALDGMLAEFSSALAVEGVGLAEKRPARCAGRRDEAGGQ